MSYVLPISTYLSAGDSTTGAKAKKSDLLNMIFDQADDFIQSIVLVRKP